MKKRQIPLQGKGRRFRADLWLDEKITGRTLNALQMRGVKFPDGWNPRKTPEFKQEYQRQLTQFRQQQAAKKAAKKETQQGSAEAGGIARSRAGNSFTPIINNNVCQSETDRFADRCESHPPETCTLCVGMTQGPRLCAGTQSRGTPFQETSGPSPVPIR